MEISCLCCVCNTQFPTSRIDGNKTSANLTSHYLSLIPSSSSMSVIDHYNNRKKKCDEKKYEGNIVIYHFFFKQE